MTFDLVFFALAIPAVIFAGVAKGGFAGGGAFAATPILALVIAPGHAVGLMLPLLMMMDVATLKPYWGKWDRHRGAAAADRRRARHRLRRRDLPLHQSRRLPAADRCDLDRLRAVPARPPLGPPAARRSRRRAARRAAGRFRHRLHQLRRQCRQPAGRRLPAAQGRDQDRVSGDQRHRLLGGESDQVHPLPQPWHRHLGHGEGGSHAGPLRARSAPGSASGPTMQCPSGCSSV